LDPGLKNSIAKSPKIGVSVLYSELQSNKQYENEIIKRFSSVTPENAMKFEVLHPQPGESNFTEADFIIDWAKLNKLNVRGHPIIWHRQIPSWLKEMELPDSKFQELFESHISELVSRYKDSVLAWDVVNEAFNSDGSLRKSIWLKNLGPEYIKDAFILAHHANPRAKLFYNDYDIEKPGIKSDAVYNLLIRLLAIKVPIHGIGFQMHLRPGFTPTEMEIETTLKKFADLGLEIHITELDVAIPVPSTDEDRQKQKEKFEMVARICEKMESCKVLSLWGLHDGVSWIPSHFKGLGEATLFDEQINKKECYEAFREGLNKRLY